MRCCETSAPEERLEGLLRIISKVDKEANVSPFRVNKQCVFNREDMLLDLLELVKGLCEGDHKPISETELDELLEDSSSFNTVEAEESKMIKDKANSTIIDKEEQGSKKQISAMKDVEEFLARFNEEENRRNCESKGKMSLKKHSLNIAKPSLINKKRGLSNQIPKRKKVNAIEIAKSSSFSLSSPHCPSQTIEHQINSQKSNQSCQGDIVIGIKTPCHSSLSFFFDKQPILYYLFLKPSDIIVDSSMSYLIKRPMFDITSSSRLNLLHPQRTLNSAHFHSSSTPFVSADNTKHRIYSWLVDLNMFKKREIAVNELPFICANGIFLCDLLNKCEGRFANIKGVNRKIKNVSQVKVNIKKALEYLRKKETFPCRRLWAIDDIKGGNEAIIWELLEDIWRLYTNNKLNRVYSSNNLMTPREVSHKTHRSTNSNSQQSMNSNMKMTNDQHVNMFKQQNSLKFYNSLIKQTCTTSKARKPNSSAIQIFNNFSIHNEPSCDAWRDKDINTKDASIAPMTTGLPEKYLVF